MHIFSSVYSIQGNYDEYRKHLLDIGLFCPGHIECTWKVRQADAKTDNTQ